MNGKYKKQQQRNILVKKTATRMVRRKIIKKDDQAILNTKFINHKQKLEIRLQSVLKNPSH